MYLMSVSDTKLRNAKAQSKNYRIAIGDNTYLDVMTTGRKVWRMRYNKPDSKKPAIYTIGEYPDIKQVEARQAAQDAKKLVRQGIDPTLYRIQERQRLEQAAQAEIRAKADSFESVARAWHKHRHETLKKWKPTHAVKILKSLEVDVFPKIGAIPVGDLGAPDILDVVQAVVNRGAIEAAKKINQRINAVLRYAVVRKLVRHNEADNLRDEIPTAKARHNPHLTIETLPAFLRALENDQSMGEVVKIAIKLTMHTLCRTGEIRFSRWSEFDLEAGLWTIPADRTKTKQTHSIPLSRQVLALLDRLKAFTGQYDYLCVTRGFNHPMSENAMLYALYRMGYGGRLTIHGLRGTASTILNDAGFRGEVIEAALAHKERNAIRSAYNHAQYLEERRTMLQWYSDHLDALKMGAQIIPIHHKRG